jgi:hypothetical protein
MTAHFSLQSTIAFLILLAFSERQISIGEFSLRLPIGL